MLFIFSWCLLRNPFKRYDIIKKRGIVESGVGYQPHKNYSVYFNSIEELTDEDEWRVVNDFINVYTSILNLKNDLELPKSNSLYKIFATATGVDKIYKTIKSYFNENSLENQHNEEPRDKTKLDLSKIPKFYRRVIDIIAQEDNSASLNYVSMDDKFHQLIDIDKIIHILQSYAEIVGKSNGQENKFVIEKKIMPLKSYSQILKKATNANEEHEDRIVKDFIYVYTSLLSLKDNSKTSNAGTVITILAADKVMEVIKSYFNENEDSSEEASETNSAAKLDLSKIPKFYRRVVDVITKVKEQEENSIIKLGKGKFIDDTKSVATGIGHGTGVICSKDEFLDPKLHDKCLGTKRSDNSENKEGNAFVKTVKEIQPVKGYYDILWNNEMSEEANRVVISVM
ncbi:hypothetical protein GPJ56_005059 [Histomonas meleagridis]|uniref:uncharacterized protein n=1 Tax=Histomonas meleagridis TaxID=135588 RepID=UPI003559FBF0|nr:hypothetical protein GPJ56_005059 [Histomonas meleagridis]KAH0802576.1 hypothetical protein GO595_004625 [Histomonas meleagridis]